MKNPPKKPVLSLPAEAISSTDQAKATTEVTETATAASLQSQALAILDRACVSCHSATNIQGNFGSLDNLEAMIASGRYLVPGDPERSLIFSKLAPTGNMPPGKPLTTEELAILKSWISELKAPELTLVSESELLTLIQNDLQTKVPAAERAATRYFSLQVANNIGAQAGSLESYRKALFKVLNSLSQAVELHVPEAVDSKKLLYRVNLDRLAIPVSLFDQVMLDYNPFQLEWTAVPGDKASAERAALDLSNRELTQSKVYLLRADWFVATATLPVPYERLLQMGADHAALDASLGLDLAANIRDRKVMRAGFKNSGVSSQNRIIERHLQSNQKPYWISYDFVSNLASSNIFSNPLGPVGTSTGKAFRHDGGEIIFQLPNGLFGYRLVSGAGATLDKGPTSIVKQTDAPPQFLSAIVNGVSCMNCHGAGLLFKKDELRDFMLQNSLSFSSAEQNQLLALYPADPTLKDTLNSDNESYFTALKALGINPADPDPVNQTYRFYNRALSMNDVQIELGLSEQQMQNLLSLEPFRSQWSSLSTKGMISREEFNQLLDKAWLASRLDLRYQTSLLGDFLVTASCMFADAVQMDHCLLKTPADGVSSL